MKKPFLLLKTKKDKCKLLLFVLLCLAALSLFFNTTEKAVLWQESTGGKSLYGYIGSLC